MINKLFIRYTCTLIHYSFKNDKFGHKLWQRDLYFSHHQNCTNLNPCLYSPLGVC